MPAVDHHPVLIRWLTELKAKFDPITAIEVGVASGICSEALLRGVPGLHLYLCDYFKKQGVIEFVQARTAGFNRVLVPGCSWESAKRFPEGFQAALVFIDAGHGLESVRKDIAAYWPLVAPGGYFTGHDILSHKNDDHRWGVKTAVEEFSQQVGLPYEIVGTCWIIKKP